jgi:hypothetical protein
MATAGRERLSLGAALDSVLFVFAGAAAVWLALVVLEDSLQIGWQLLLLVVFWALVAYLVLPRIHRILTRLYLPDYFIGRTRTADGLLGDPVNLAFLGDEAQVHAALTAGGWTRADDIDRRSVVEMIRSTLTRRTYPTAPVSPLFLFDRQQDFAYQEEVDGNPAQRHHVRFWRCPDGWLLPGGYAVDWLAAGTYDRSVGLSLLTFQVTHRIAADIDVERDHIVTTVCANSPGASVEVIENFSTGFHDRNGGGDAIRTDGDLPVVDLRRVAAPPEAWASPRTDSRDRRPAATAFGAAVAALRGITSAGLVLSIVLDATVLDLGLVGLDAHDRGAPSSTAAIVAVAVLVAGLAALDFALAVATYRGRNWARVVIMLASAVSITGAFVAHLRGAAGPLVGTGLVNLALGVLVLLALSSHRARRFALRDRVAPPART